MYGAERRPRTFRGTSSSTWSRATRRPAYIQRIATIFNNNGSGVRGDLQGRRQGDPPRSRGAAGDAGQPRVRPPEGAGASHDAPAAGHERAVGQRRRRPRTATLRRRFPPWGRTRCGRRRSSATTRPITWLPARRSGGRSSALFQSTTALKRANFVNTMVFSNIPATAATGNAPNGTSIDSHAADRAGRQPEHAGQGARSRC